jgi:hypothetical protein
MSKKKKKYFPLTFLGVSNYFDVEFVKADAAVIN